MMKPTALSHPETEERRTAPVGQIAVSLSFADCSDDQRVGARAGRSGRSFSNSKKSPLFLRPDYWIFVALSSVTWLTEQLKILAVTRSSEFDSQYMVDFQFFLLLAVGTFAILLFDQKFDVVRSACAAVLHLACAPVYFGRSLDGGGSFRILSLPIGHVKRPLVSVLLRKPPAIGACLLRIILAPLLAIFGILAGVLRKPLFDRPIDLWSICFFPLFGAGISLSSKLRVGVILLGKATSAARRGALNAVSIVCEALYNVPGPARATGEVASFASVGCLFPRVSHNGPSAMRAIQRSKIA